MQEIIMLTPYLLTKFHGFIVYLAWGNVSMHVSPKASTDWEAMWDQAPTRWTQKLAGHPHPGVIPVFYAKTKYSSHA
jgi:hypothetical protein